MTKRIISVFIAVIMAFTFISCTSDKDMRGSIASDNNSSDASENQSTDASSENNGGDAEISLGSSKGNHYENAFIGIQCDLNKDWTFKTDEEIRKINEQAVGMMRDDYAKIMEAGTAISDMYASKSNQTETVNVNIEKLALANYGITEAEYAKVGIKTAIDGLESAGIKNLSSDIRETTFAGSTHTCMVINSDYNGSPIYQKVVAVKCKGAVAIITATAYYEDTTDEILNCFKAL